MCLVSERESSASVGARIHDPGITMPRVLFCFTVLYCMNITYLQSEQINTETLKPNEKIDIRKKSNKLFLDTRLF